MSVQIKMRNWQNRYLPPEKQGEDIECEVVRMSRCNPTCECGLRYVRGLPEDEDYHAKIHKEYALGPVIPKVCTVPGITKVGNLAVHVVDASVPLDVRQDIAHVAMVAARSMPEYPSGYDGTITEDDPRLYVLATGDRTVGFVLTALDKSFWRLSWIDHILRHGHICQIIEGYGCLPCLVISQYIRAAPLEIKGRLRLS